MRNQVTLARRAYFSAGRRLRNPEWSDERNRQVFGKLASPHGHDYVLDVFYQGAVSDEDGMIVNISELKPVIAAVVDQLDGKFLDQEVPEFAARRPTAENIVDFIWNKLPHCMGTGRLTRLRLEETSRLWVEKTETSMRITRKYEFAAAHRLYAPQLPEEENCARYGKCANPSGHGHNYTLEVALEGTPDADTGMIIPLTELDRIVDEEVMEPFDHKHLNEDCPDFANLIPTSENFARVLFERLRSRLDHAGYRLAKVGLHETTKNYFEVEASE
ncbi:MAG: 6-carboxytetrahydropterin synthase [Armatimonadota bacterium]|nr:6-carboxytetrahydropterin synthase [Armatimonadota bacterium]